MRLTKIVDAMMWVLLTLALLRTTILVRRRDTSEFAEVDTSATFAIFVVASLLALLVIHPRGKAALMRMRESSVMIFLIYLVYAAVSAAWSENFQFTLFRAGEVLAVFGTLFVLMEGFTDWRKAERAMLIVLMLVTLLGVGQRIIIGDFSIAGLHTNLYSVTAGMGFLYTLAESLRADPARKRRLRIWSGVFLFFAIIGTSAGSNIGIAVGMLVLLPFLSHSKVILIPAGLGCLGVIAIMGTSEELVSTTLLSGRSLEEASTLTGRWSLWNAYWQAFLESPMVGRGFAIVARLGDQFGTIATTNAHNGFIEALVGLGIIGFITLLAYSVRLILECIKASRSYVAGGLGVLVAMTMIMVNNNSKSILGGAYDPSVVGVFAMLAFFHVFTLRAARAKEAAAASGQRTAPETAGRASALHS
ncbi:O-antigen ligase family protein [Aurantiacibacter odishensis]|uniref:O-antigen ligase family protein n=1 Tax=Aurantiacibacter odishensis TaxID=1155476 RepID=UPI0013C53754|nr:O-antigen ligase family protein [Aurantiacibacter odishensis]